MGRADWKCWLLLLAVVVTVANGQQNSVDQHDEEHNPMGCDCMEYWACITRYVIFQNHSSVFITEKNVHSCFDGNQPIVVAVRLTAIVATWIKVCVATCLEAPDRSDCCPFSTSPSADGKATWPLPLAIANEPTDWPIWANGRGM